MLVTGRDAEREYSALRRGVRSAGRKFTARRGDGDGRGRNPGGGLRTLRSLLPSGAVWMVDGTGPGVADSPTPELTVLSQFSDIIGSAHFGVSATASKRPRRLPADYLANGRQGVQFWNASSGGKSQYFADSVTDDPIFKPFLAVDASSGATLALTCINRGDVANGQIIGNFTGALTGPGFYVLLQPAGTIEFAMWKAGGSIIINRSGASAPLSTLLRIIIVIRTDRTYSVYVNGSEVYAGSTSATSVVPTITAPITIGSYSTTDGVGGTFGGQLYHATMWHRALSVSEVTSLNGTLGTWYGHPSPAFDTGPPSGATALSDVDVAVLGTSIDFGYNDDANNGYAGQIETVLDPAWSDLSLTFYGGNPGAVVDVCAVGSQAVRTDGAFTGFDTISTDHALRMDHQLATMNGDGAFAVGRTLIVTCPVGWTNGIRSGPGNLLAFDHHGDLVRMLVRFVAGVRAYDPGHAIRFVLHTCTPITAAQPEIVLHNASIRTLANAIAAATGCLIVCVDTATVINSNKATYIDADNLHLTAAGHDAIATPIGNGIRYVSGLT